MDLRSEEVVPGVWSLPVPLPGTGLGRIHSYALEADGRLLMVDLGLGGDASLDAFETRLAEMGASIADVDGVLFTHVHPDHYGLAGSVRERSGAWLAIHGGDVPYLDGRRRRPDFMQELSEEAGLELGGPEVRFGRGRALATVMPDRTFADGDVIDHGRWRIEVVHTPGHSPGHSCFALHGAGVIILGDHILSRTTPNVSHWPWSDGDPLADYLASLRRVARLGAGSLGLPGHEERIADIPARAQEIITHHCTQLAAVTELVNRGHDTIGAVAERMRWSRGWPELGHVDRVMAVGEALAHLRTLERRGALRRIEGPPRRFARA